MFLTDLDENDKVTPSRSFYNEYHRPDAEQFRFTAAYPRGRVVLPICLPFVQLGVKSLYRKVGRFKALFGK